MRRKHSQTCPMCSGHYGKAAVHSYDPEEAMKLQAATYGKLRRLTNRLKPRQLTFRVAENEWSIKEIITHLADTELVYSFRYRKILAEERPDLSFFDQQLWAGNLDYHQRDFNSVLAMFKAVRQNNLDLMKLKPMKDWLRIGSHAEFGPLTFAQLVVHVVDHDLSHLKQIRSVRQRIRSRGRPTKFTRQ